MYIRGLIPRNFAELAEVVPIAAAVEYPMSVRSEMDPDPESQSRGHDMTSLQTVPGLIPGLLTLSC